jgi:hypothetical protein
MERVARGFSLFMNWFDGIAAPVCGLWMMASICPFVPLNWGGFMSLSVFDRFPFHDVFFTSFFWPGLALALINGAPNIVSLVFRAQGDRKGSYTWSIAAGVLLVIWTGVEMAFIPNGASVFYMVLGVLQLAAGIVARRSAA